MAPFILYRSITAVKQKGSKTQKTIQACAMRKHAMRKHLEVYKDCMYTEMANMSMQERYYEFKYIHRAEKQVGKDI
jgi:hypothetical protein